MKEGRGAKTGRVKCSEKEVNDEFSNQRGGKRKTGDKGTNCGPI